MIEVKVINKSGCGLPEYKTSMSAGCDIHAKLGYPIKLGSLDRVTVLTGLYLSFPEGYEAQVRPRSGLTAKYGIVVVQGTIDADYRGEVGVTLINLSNEEYTIQPGERIAQFVFNKIEKACFIEVDSLDKTDRGEGGFGSTGK